MNEDTLFSNVKARDYIAIHSAIAMLSNDELRNGMAKTVKKDYHNLIFGICQSAYEFADHLILESNINKHKSN